MVIKHEGTQELFHVDAVSHQYSMNESQTDRSTQISVSRGMVEQYARGIRRSGPTTELNTLPEISYFNIVDLDKDQLGESTGIASNFKLNEEVFEFFLKARQFA